MQSPQINAPAPALYPVSVAGIESSRGFHLLLAALRKERGHVQQLNRYEAGCSLPTLEVICNLATALSVSSNQLLFGKDERGGGRK